MSEILLKDGFAATPERCLWHAGSKTAVVADLHLGAEPELSRRGIFMPDVSSKALRQAWGRMCERVGGGGRIVVAGDLFDVPAAGREAVEMARELFRSVPAGCEVVLIPGNHDPSEAVLREMFEGVTVAVAVMVGGYTVIHGHESGHTVGFGEGEWVGKGKVRQWVPRGMIVGHQHPAVVVGNRVQSAKMICFGVCELEARTAVGGKLGRRVPLILLPTFSRAPLGSTLSENHWIVDMPRPLEEDVRVLGIVEVDGGRVLDFGTLASLRLPF